MTDHVHRVQWRRSTWLRHTSSKHRTFLSEAAARGFVGKLRRKSDRWGPLEWVRVDSRPLAGDWQPVLELSDDLAGSEPTP